MNPRAFAQQPDVTQQTTSAKSTISDRAYFAQSPDMNSLLHLQRTIGNQAVQRMLQTNPEELEKGSASKTLPRFAHDFGQVPARTKSQPKVQAKLTVGLPAIRVAFDKVRYSPQMDQGQRLIAHGLTHAVQRSRSNRIGRGQADETHGRFPIADNVVQRKPDRKGLTIVGDPIDDENFPEHAWHLMVTTNSRGSPPFTVIRAIIAENTGIDRDLLAATTVTFHYRNYVKGGTIRPSYFSFRHSTKGIVARAFAELQGFHPERKPDTKLLLKENYQYDVYIFSPRLGNAARPYTFPMPLASAPPLAPDIEQEQEPEPESKTADIGETVADLATDLIPGVSNVKDFFIAATGINPVTGEKVGIAGRIISGIFAIPGLGNLLKYIGKGGKGLGKGIKWLAKLIHRGRVRRKIATLNVVIRLGGTGLNRQLIKEFGKEGLEKLVGSLGSELTVQLAKELGPQTLKQAVDRLGAQGLKELAEKHGSTGIKDALVKGVGEKAVKETAEEKAVREAAEKAEKEAAEKGEKEASETAAKKERCYAIYLQQTAYCGETYTDDKLYELCMGNAWTNYIRCLNGLPPKPLVPHK